MTQPQPQAPTITPEQVVQSCSAGLQLFNLDTTLIPGNMRRQVAVLEAVLQGIATGNLQVVSVQQPQVESESSEDVSDLTGEDKQDGRTTDAPPA